MRVLPLLVVALVLAGCLEGPSSAPPVDDTEVVPFETLLHQGDQPVFEEPLARALTQAEWEAAWERYARGHLPPPERPAVDFATQRVVAVSTGQKGSGCHAVSIDRMVRESGEITATVVVFDGEAPDRACTAQVVWPTHVVAVNDTESPLRFSYVTERPPSAPAGNGSLPFRTLERGSFSGVGEDARLLLRDEAAWEALWERHRADEPRPEVDFAEESVVAVVEHGPTGCFGIHVGNATYDLAREEIVVEVVHEPTPPEVQCIQAIMDAYHFVALPDRPGSVRFVDVRPEPAADEGGLGVAPREPQEPTPGEGETGAYAFRTLAKGSHSGIEERTRRVLDDEASWAAFWDMHASVSIPAPERPEVDFSKEHVFVATAGERPDSCWSIEVTGIDVHENNVNVRVATRGPDASMACADVVTHPFHFVTYPKTDKPYLLTESSP